LQGCYADKEAKEGKSTHQRLRNLNTGQRQSFHDGVGGEDACDDAEALLRHQKVDQIASGL